jgi:hypothetical protein
MPLLIHKVDPKYPESHLELRNPENTRSIDIKWDGCVNIRDYCNGDTCDTEASENCCYIHICDLKEFIAQLQEAYDRAKAINFEMD